MCVLQVWPAALPPSGRSLTRQDVDACHVAVVVGQQSLVHDLSPQWRHPRADDHDCVTRWKLRRFGRTSQALVPQTRIRVLRSEEHTSELQSLMRTSYAVFCFKKKTTST